MDSEMSVMIECDTSSADIWKSSVYDSNSWTIRSTSELWKSKNVRSCHANKRSSEPTEMQSGSITWTYEVILSRTPLWPHIPEIVVERNVLLLSDRRVRFFSVSDNRISTDRSLSCIESVETKKRAANVRPIMFDADTNRDWGIPSSGNKNSKTSNSPTTTKAIPPVLTSTKSKWETRKARPGRRRSFVSCVLCWERRVYISFLLRIYDRKDTEASSTSTYRYDKRSPCLSSRSLNFFRLIFDRELCILKWRKWYLTAVIIDIYIYIYIYIYILFGWYRVSIYIDTLN